MTARAIEMLNRALQANDPDMVRSEIRAAIAELRQPIGTYNSVSITAPLEKAVKAFPSAAAAAAAWGVSRQVLHAVRNGDRPCPPRILAALGLEKVPSGRRLYREVE
jgi:hypothetical protein